MKLLFVGSGNSAKKIKQMDLSDYQVVCCNNAWRLFDKTNDVIFFHSGDFPIKQRPTNWLGEIVSYKQYEPAIKHLAIQEQWETKTPLFHVGYTIFFMGLYWIVANYQPNEIHLLGFDHDYNQEKVKKWESIGQPTPFNNFCGGLSNLEEWYRKEFSEFEPDTFYGMGTPDPLRLGKKYLIDKFLAAKKYCDDKNIRVINLSGVDSEINCFPQLDNDN